MTFLSPFFLARLAPVGPLHRNLPLSLPAKHYLSRTRVLTISRTMTVSSHRQDGIAHTRTGEIVVEKRKEVKWTDAPPAHHANKSATRFQNPWESFRCVPQLYAALVDKGI